MLISVMLTNRKHWVATQPIMCLHPESHLHVLVIRCLILLLVEQWHLAGEHYTNWPVFCPEAAYPRPAACVTAWPHARSMPASLMAVRWPTPAM